MLDMNIDTLTEMGLEVWDLIESGSAKCEVSHGRDLASMEIHNDRLIIDIRDDQKLKLILALINNYMNQDNALTSKNSEKEAEGGLMDSLNQLRGIAKQLNKAGKAVIVKYQGKEVLKIGKGAHSMSLSMVGIKHIQITRKILALKLLPIAKQLPFK